MLGAVCALGIVVGNIGAPIFSKSINVFLGFPTHVVENATEDLYFLSSYETPEDQYGAAGKLARQIEQEGIVLLRNEGGALPLARGAQVTLLGQNSVDFVYGGAGSGSIDASSAAALAAMGYAAFKLSHVIAGTRTLWQVIRRKPKKGQKSEYYSYRYDAGPSCYGEGPVTMGSGAAPGRAARAGQGGPP